MATVAYRKNVDIYLNIYNTTGKSDNLAFGSKWENEEHPGSNKKMTAWKWDERQWSSSSERDTEAFIPTLLDSTYPEVPLTHWQSGIGSNDDLDFLRAKHAYRDEGLQWEAELEHGYMYFYNEEDYLFSDGMDSAFFEDTTDSGNFQYLTHSGLNKVDAPILVRQYIRNEDLNGWDIYKSFNRKADFSALTDSGTYLSIRDDSDDLIHANVNQNEPEFIVTHSGNYTTLTLNGNYIKDNAQTYYFADTVSGYLEVLGVSDGTASQSFFTDYAPLVESGINIYTYNGLLDPADTHSGLTQWTEIFNDHPSFDGVGTGTYYIPDYNWGEIQFGDGTDGDIIDSGHYVLAQYTASVRADFEVTDTTDNFSSFEADLNPVNGSPTDGILLIQKEEEQPDSIELVADLTKISTHSYGPVSVGDPFAKLIATVYTKSGAKIDGLDVQFEITSTPLTGGFNGSSSTTTSVTNVNGQAFGFYTPPQQLNDVGAATTDVTHSGLNTWMTFSGLPSPASGQSIYLYKILREDLLTGYPASGVNQYYQDYFDEEGIDYSVLSDEIDTEGYYRTAWQLPTPETYTTGDITTGTKHAVLYYDSASLNPHTGTLGAYTIKEHESYVNNTTSIDVEYSGNLDLITDSGTYKSYFVAVDTSITVRASVYDEIRGTRVYSNSITVSISISPSQNGIYIADSITALQSGIMQRVMNDSEFNAYLDTLIVSGVFTDSDLEYKYNIEHLDSETRSGWFIKTRRVDNVLLGGMQDVSTGETGSASIPLGWRLPGSNLTLASALDRVTFIEPNDTITGVTYED